MSNQQQQAAIYKYRIIEIKADWETSVLKRPVSKNVFNLDLKTGMEAVHQFPKCSWFHSLGAASAKALSPFSLSQDQGTYRRDLSSDLRDLGPLSASE